MSWHSGRYKDYDSKQRICNECDHCSDSTEYDRGNRYHGGDLKFLAEQLDSIFTDIYPDAVKTGMVSSSGLIETIADKLTEYMQRI